MTFTITEQSKLVLKIIQIVTFENNAIAELKAEVWGYANNIVGVIYFQGFTPILQYSYKK